jgi:hypothetical protein
MKIRTNIDNIDGRYNVQIETFGFSAVEEEKMQDFGEPLIDVGSDFSGSATRPGDMSPISVSFSLPPQTRRLKTDFPAKQIFDLADDSQSDVKAKVWADTIAARLLTAKTTLVDQASPFEGETVSTV